MGKKKKNRSPIYFDGDILRSEAFRTLKKVRSHLLFLDFLVRRKMARIPVGKKKKWICTNNGEIVFPYKTAVEKGYSRSQFRDAKKELVEHGLLDVSDEGGIYDGHTAKYGISERWRKYGTPEFEFKTIHKDTRKGRGWAAYWSDFPSIKRRKRKLKIKRRKRSKQN